MGHSGDTSAVCRGGREKTTLTTAMHRDGKWRILLVQEPTAGGTARHVLDLARGLDAAGHDVHLLYANRRAEPWIEAELASLDGVTRAHVDMRRAPHPSDLAAWYQIRRYAAKNGPFDLIHGHSSKGGALAMFASTRRSTARVWTPHCLRSFDPALAGGARRFYERLERLIARRADAVIAVSGEEYTHALRMGMDERKMHVVVNGVRPLPPLDRAEACARWGLASDAVCIGFVGRFAPQKAPSRIVEAFAQVSKHNDDVQLAMVGEGPLQAPAEVRARELGVADRVRWLPAATGAAAMAAFDIFAMPSVYEAMPYVLLEAAAAGLPIVATAVGGTSIAIHDGVNGYVVANWDEAVYANRLSELVADGELRARMGKASRAIAEGRTVERMIAETAGVYAHSLQQQIETKRGPSAPGIGVPGNTQSSRSVP